MDPSDPPRRRVVKQQKDLPPVVMRSRRVPRRPFHADSPRARGPVLPSLLLRRRCPVHDRAAAEEARGTPGCCAIGAARSGRVTAPPVDSGAARRDELQRGHPAPPRPPRSTTSLLRRRRRAASSWGLHPISASPAPRRRAPPDPRAGPGRSPHQRRARRRAGIKEAAPAAHSLLCPISFSFLPVLTTGGRDKGGGGAPLGVPRECTHGSSCCCCFSFPI